MVLPKASTALLRTNMVPLRANTTSKAPCSTSRVRLLPLRKTSAVAAAKAVVRAA